MANILGLYVSIQRESTDIVVLDHFKAIRVFYRGTGLGGISGLDNQIRRELADIIVSGHFKDFQAIVIVFLSRDAFPTPKTTSRSVIRSFEKTNKKRAEVNGKKFLRQ